MGRSKRQRLEFRFYEIPQNEHVLALLGDAWRRVYGHDVQYMHFHNLMEIGVCHEGKGVLTLDGRDCPYTGGMIAVIPANCPHHTRSEGEDFWEYLYLDPAQILRELYPNNQKLQEEKLALFNRRAVLLGEEGAALTGAAREIIREMQRQDAYYRDVVRDLVKIFLLRLLRLNEEPGAEPQTERAARPQIQPALVYIQEQFRQDIRAEDLARQCGLSEPHFRRVFREYVDMSPIDYLNAVRLCLRFQLHAKFQKAHGHHTLPVEADAGKTWQPPARLQHHPAPGLGRDLNRRYFKFWQCAQIAQSFFVEHA